MPHPLCLLLTSSVLIAFLGLSGCTRGDAERDPAGPQITGAEKMNAPLRRALRNPEHADDHLYDVLLGVSEQTASDAAAFMELQQDLRAAGLTLRTISGPIVTVRGTRSAIQAVAADDRIASLELSASRSLSSS